jgi:hypothetical protein
VHFSQAGSDEKGICMMEEVSSMKIVLTGWWEWQHPTSDVKTQSKLGKVSPHSASMQHWDQVKKVKMIRIIETSFSMLKRELQIRSYTNQ